MMAGRAMSGNEQMVLEVCHVVDMDLTAVRMGPRIVFGSMEAQEVFQVVNAEIVEIAVVDVELSETVEKVSLWKQGFLVNIDC